MSLDSENNQSEKELFYSKLDSILPGSIESVKGLTWDVYFERVSMNGLEEMHDYSIDERLYQFLEFDAFVTIDETKDYINKLLSRIGEESFQRTAMYWFVRRKSDNKLIGSMGLLNIDFHRSSTEWGFGVDPKLWNNGYILQMLEILKEYVFEVLSLNRVFSTTMSINEAVIAILKSIGFQYEGELRDYYKFTAGEFQNASIYSMLASEYFAIDESDSKIPVSNDSELVTSVIEIVSEVLRSSTVQAETKMRDEPAWDSLRHVSIMLQVSEKYGVQLTPLEIAKATSVQSICSILGEK